MQKSLAQIVSGMRNIEDHVVQSNFRTGSSFDEDIKSTHSIENPFQTQTECSTSHVLFNQLAIIRNSFGNFEYHEIRKRKLKNGNKKLCQKGVAHSDSSLLLGLWLMVLRYRIFLALRRLQAGSAHFSHSEIKCVKMTL